MVDDNDNTELQDILVDEEEDKSCLHADIEQLRADGERWFHVELLVDKEKYPSRDVHTLEESLYAALFTAIEAINVEMAKQPPETQSGIVVPHSH